MGSVLPVPLLLVFPPSVPLPASSVCSSGSAAMATSFAARIERRRRIKPVSVDRPQTYLARRVGRREQYVRSTMSLLSTFFSGKGWQCRSVDGSHNSPRTASGSCASSRDRKNSATVSMFVFGAIMVRLSCVVASFFKRTDENKRVGDERHILCRRYLRGSVGVSGLPIGMTVTRHLNPWSAVRIGVTLDLNKRTIGYLKRSSPLTLDTNKPSRADPPFTRFTFSPQIRQISTQFGNNGRRWINLNQQRPATCYSPTMYSTTRMPCHSLLSSPSER